MNHFPTKALCGHFLLINTLLYVYRNKKCQYCPYLSSSFRFFLQNEVEKYFAQLGERGNAPCSINHDVISFRDYVFFCFVFLCVCVWGGGGYFLTRLSRPILSSKFLDP